MLKIKDLHDGAIIWKGYDILGIKGATLDLKYYDYYCIRLQGNINDFNLVEKVSDGNE